VQRLAFRARAFFAGAEGAKVFGRLGDGITKETHDDATAVRASLDFHVKVDLGGDLFEVVAAWCRGRSQEVDGING